MSINVKKYEITQAKTGKWVPIINDVHLHSSFDPEKEAQSLVERYESTLKEKKHILILGLGFGYHVDAIYKRLEKYHGNDYQICIIEPCLQTLERLSEVNPGFNRQQITIFQSDEPQKLYESESLISFLTKKPGVISHPASFNLFSEFFKAYLTHVASDNINDIARLTQDANLQNYLTSFGEVNLGQALFNIKKVRPILDNDYDFLLLAYERFLVKKEDLQQRAKA